ncbi:MULTISPECIES: DEAD/DEAH box helicase [Bacillaceae]|uniref:DEAD/DEAH box helicase n=1 Tax=Evansella alkalicola TaxID=745819 RepID=A0ABS6JT28_9BACI|nr:MULTISPECIES: DEAD/DEAH box helicase [Bacillaceae]MBU9721734.1 DEAD/DEAH box helicase [Bacillus alkalicola]
MRFYTLNLSEIEYLKNKHTHRDLTSTNHLLPYTTINFQDNEVWLLPEFPSHSELALHPLYSEPTIQKKNSKTIFKLASEGINFYFPPPNHNFQNNSELVSIIKKRQLLFDEIPFSMEEIHVHACHGFVSYSPGVMKGKEKGSGEGGQLQCKRCGNRDPFLFGTHDCYRCKEKCTYCRSCLMMGKVSTCTPLCEQRDGSPVHEVGGERENRPHVHEMAWSGTLSFFQQKASDKLCQTIEAFLQGTNEKDTFLSWAVCGAGKTEMLFYGIQLALNAGLNVLIATPRTDVVLELEPRFKEAFPKTNVQALYGGAENRFAQGELIISTTHQVLRFHKAFDIVIIDEVDAFPYTADRKLRYGVDKAKHNRSLTVFVSATPDEKMKRAAEKGEILSVKVARRYHKHPLPEPRFQWVGQWKKQLERKSLPVPLRKWLEGHLASRKQIFLFIPSVAIIEKVMNALEKELRTEIESVHSSDPDRREKVMQFRKGVTRVLVTTTILERGVTVKDVQVGVVGAEDRIFTESALVQISGRAGRSPDCPRGDVVFFHYGKTEEMVKAVRHIKEMNKLGEAELREERKGE